ncbi:hypothetical protein GCM10009679_20570 [Saccharothrix algeriensis]|uniref:Integrase catalytic domain-containing protein n=1 Tax=Catellatospora bangladeshensis TaxID=310355 RepID=A0A8J3JCZ0_9ACTN|nr:hypothetical protein Cba03nite_34200 [Catellatospora bangladeshensis]
MLFDRICRENGVVHRLTQPASPTTTGKVERFHRSLREELLNHSGVFAEVAAALAAVDAWVAEYNTARPHQSLDMASPAQRFRPVEDPVEMPLRLPVGLREAVNERVSADVAAMAMPLVAQPWDGGPVEFDRVVAPSGNMEVRGKQFWLGPARSGVLVTFWADTDVIHLLIGGSRVKSVRSHLSVTDLEILARDGGRRAGPSPLPPPTPG